MVLGFNRLIFYRYLYFIISVFSLVIFATPHLEMVYGSRGAGRKIVFLGHRLVLRLYLRAVINGLAIIPLINPALDGHDPFIAVAFKINSPVKVACRGYLEKHLELI